MEASSVALSFCDKIQWLADTPKDQLARWRITKDLTLAKADNCAKNILEAECLEAFKYFQNEIRNNHYAALADPKLSNTIPLAYRRLKSILKRAGLLKNQHRDFRIEMIAHMPLVQNREGFYSFDFPMAASYYKKIAPDILKQTYEFLEKEINASLRSELDDNILDDLTRLVYLLNDVFRPFLLFLLPTNERGSQLRKSLDYVRNLFLPFIEKVLPKEQLNAAEAGFLDALFVDPRCRIRTRLSVYFQIYWMGVFRESLDLNLSAEKRLGKFFRLWSYYTPANEYAPTKTLLRRRFLATLLPSLPELLKSVTSFNRLKMVCQDYVGDSPLTAAVKDLDFNDRVQEIISEGKFLEDDGHDHLKISKEWRFILDQLVPDPTKFLEALFRTHQQSALKDEKFQLLRRFVNGPSLLQYPHYFIQLAQSCVNTELQQELLERIARIDIENYYQLSECLGKEKNYSWISSLLIEAKQCKNDAIAEICYARLAQALKESFLRVNLQTLDIPEEDFKKVVTRCVFDKVERFALFADIARLPRLTSAGIKLLSAKFKGINWVNYPFDTESKLSDVVFVCGNRKLWMNSWMLRSVSDFFNARLSGRFIEYKEGETSVHEIELEESHFAFFNRFAPIIICPTSNAYTQVLVNPNYQFDLKNYKAAFKLMMEGEANPLAVCLENLNIAQFYQLTILLDLLDRIYTLMVSPMPIIHPDPESLAMRKRVTRAVESFRKWVIDLDKKSIYLKLLQTIEGTNFYRVYSINHLIRSRQENHHGCAVM